MNEKLQNTLGKGGTSAALLTSKKLLGAFLIIF